MTDDRDRPATPDATRDLELPGGRHLRTCGLRTHGSRIRDFLTPPLAQRALRPPAPPVPPPGFGLYLGSDRSRRRHSPTMTWPQRWVRWPDFRIPSDHADAVDALVDLHRRLPTGTAADVGRADGVRGQPDPVELGCRGGVGRTGTALACLAVLDGLDPADAVRWVRAAHHPRAVETPGQRRWVVAFGRSVR